MSIALPQDRTPGTTTAPSISLGRVVILVRDYATALAFYQAALGATVLFDATTPTGQRLLHVGFLGGQPGATSAGFWLLEPSGPEATALIGRQTGGHPLAVLYTPDCAGAVARFTAAGGTLRRPAQTADGATFAHVEDLYGNELILVQLPSAP